MTDRENPLGPMPPPPYNEEQHDRVGPSGALDHNGESNRSEYVLNLEAEVQGMRERIAELEGLRSQPVQSVMQPTPPAITMPPPATRPIGASSSQPPITNPPIT